MNTLFERSENYKDEWLTPPTIIKALGDFDLDPCSPVKRPWDTAKVHFTIEDNGFMKEWSGRVWCNPPYSDCEQWVLRCSDYGNCIALTFARTDTVFFQKYVFGRAHGLLFIKGRVKFYHSTGQISENSPGAPSVLIAYGENNANALKECGIKGFFVKLK